MKDSLTELVFILDKSGSMSPLTEDTIGGFNSMLEKQRAEDGEPEGRRCGNLLYLQNPESRDTAVL